MNLRMAAAALSALATILGTASTAQAQGMPQSVMGTIREMDGLCRQVGGAPGDRSGLILTTDITGDGIRDWVVDQVNYRCEGAVSLYGLQRMPVTLYVEQWGRLLDYADELRAFLKEHDSELKRKDR